MSLLEGKTAFVTGGTRGMGEAIVKRFAKEKANVFFTYTKSAEKAQDIVKEIEKAGGKAKGFQVDAAVKGEIARALESAAQEAGSIDILVNNAAISVLGPLENAAGNTEEYDRQIDVNIRAVTEAVRTVQNFMPDGGRIINIGSVGGKRIGSPYLSEYIATKAAVSAYTRGLAWDLAPRKITVNSVEPGAVDTDMLPQDETARNAYLNAIPLRRFGKPEEIAALVSFLAGPEAGYITGSSYTIDGGISA